LQTLLIERRNNKHEYIKGWRWAIHWLEC
jgi:hypothetical protein